MDPINELRIDPEFADKIPPLTPEEYEQLEANILSEGTVLSPLIIWNNIIVDGHNRYKIIKAHPEIGFTTHEKEFADRYEAIAWICKNQLGRRNLTEAQKKYLLVQQYEAVKASHGSSDRFRGNQYVDIDLVSGENHHLPKPMKTRERIARENGKTDDYLKRAQSFVKGLNAAEEASPGIRQEILSGIINPTERAVIAVARASPEERPQLAEDLRKPRPSPKKKKPEPTESLSEEDSPENTRPTSALSISERMASTPERVNRDSPVDFIITELTDALDGMIFRWDFCLSDNKTTASSEECCRQIRELAAKGITYLKSYQGRKKKK